MMVITKRQIPVVNTRQLVWQPVTDNGDLAMRLAPIDWQPSGAHACIQMLTDDLRDAEAKLAECEARLGKAVDALRDIMSNDDLYPWRKASAALAELETK